MDIGLEYKQDTCLQLDGVGLHAITLCPFTNDYYYFILFLAFVAKNVVFIIIASANVKVLIRSRRAFDFGTTHPLA